MSLTPHLEAGDRGDTPFLPVNQKLHRDWVGVFAGVMYLLVFLLMFWAKLKSFEAILRSFLVLLFIVYMNSELLLSHLKIYPILKIFHRRLLVEYFGSAFVTLAFLCGGPIGTGSIPCLLTGFVYVFCALYFNAFLHPAAVLAQYACRSNGLLGTQAMLFVAVQLLGSASAALLARLMHLPDATDSMLKDLGHHLAEVPWYDVMLVEIVYTAIIMAVVRFYDSKISTAFALSLPPLLRVFYGAYSGLAGDIMSVEFQNLAVGNSWKGPMLLLLNPCVEAGAALYAVLAEEEFASRLLPRVVHAVLGCALVAVCTRNIFQLGVGPAATRPMKKIA